MTITPSWLYLLAVVLFGASCSAAGRDEAVRMAVWEYQLSSYSHSLAGRTVCVGLVTAMDTPGVTDPAPDVIAALNASAPRVRPASQCGPGRPLDGFLLGPVTYEGGSHATVEGTSLEGHYRYHLERSKTKWRVQGGEMTVIY